KDSNKQSDYPNLFPNINENVTPTSFSWSSPTADLKHSPDIIPQFSPTKPPPTVFFFRFTSEVEYPLSPDHILDDESNTNSIIHDTARARPYSAAAQSLRQLQYYTAARVQPHRTFSSYPSPTSPTFSSNGLYLPALLRSNNNNNNNHNNNNNNSNNNNHSNNSSSGLTTPSLSSASSHSSSPISFPHNHLSYGSSRPLPPRSQSAACSSSPRSIELVTPHLSAPVHTGQKKPSATNNRHQAEGTDLLLYEKNWTLPTVGRQTGSLKKLFNFEGMQGRPAVVRVGSSGYAAKGYVSTSEYEMAVTTTTRSGERMVPTVTYVGGRNGV
ncbi:hypothetical protein GP486_008621, partial [Trichoglossum hirsutum]